MIGRALIIWSSTIVVAVNVPSMVGFMGKDGAPEVQSDVAANVVSASMEDGRYYVLKANEGGHFAGRFRINGKPVDSLIDTGATFVTMSETTARTLGYGGNELAFRYEVA